MSDPKFVLSKKVVLEKYQELKSYADLISYSSKTNQEVTRILEQESDSLFSVHFKNELKHVKDCSRVIFLAQGWNHEDIEELIGKGITTFIVDNEMDLDILLEYLENKEKKVDLYLRLKISEHSIKTERYFVFGMGADVINQRIPQLRNNKNINKLGVHFHRKTQNMSEWNLQYELSHIFKKETLQAIDLLNIGGGFPSEYANTNINVLQSIYTKVGELRKWLHEQNIQLVLEPGRFIAAPAAKLVTRIIGIHENTIIVNASVYNSDMDAVVVPVKLLVEGELRKKEGDAYVIKGITPCSMDLFRYRVYLKNPKVGQELVFLNAGAYNFTSDFCDLEKIKTEVVK